ncbi:phage portal protein [Lysinibacillus sp. UGB7]|uniref:phage portal protein n=1 Tax=Lysinibacillus sp. UGB7 TaxID=3411039 RepID=UPI003B79DF47
MNLFEKTIAIASPRLAYERYMWRMSVKGLEKSYDAGNDGRLNAGWRVVNSSAESTDKMYRDTMRARSRDLERNSDILESILLAFERNVVGTGFKLQAKTHDEQLNVQIEALFKEWARPKYCDITKQQSFAELCQMIARRKRVDGAVVIVKRYNANGYIPLVLQVFEVDELDTMMPASSGKRIVGGIEYDEFNCPVAYYIKKYDIYGLYTGNSERINANDVMFLYKKKRPSQIREITELSTTLPRVRDTNQFMEAVSVKERIAALLAVFIRRASPEGGGYGRSANAKELKTYEGKSMTPGMMMELNPGDDVSVVQPPAQGASAADFVRLQQRLSGSAQGISYEVTARDMSQVNYSSARQGLLEDNKTYTMEQDYLKEHFLKEVYEEFIEAAVLSGKLKIRDYFENKEEYLKHEWVAPGMKWIDPLKEANANKVQLATCQTTLQDVASGQGADWRELIDQRAIEIQYMKAKGVISVDGEIDEESKKLIEQDESKDGIDEKKSND